MSSFRSRPRFSQTVDTTPAKIQDQILQGIDQTEDEFEICNFSGFLCLRITEAQRHFWSPRLNLSFEPTDEDKTLVTGIYGPNANVWSLFLFAYLIVGSLAMFSGVLAISQWVIGSKPWGFWLFGTAAAVLVALYIVAQIGQKIGAQQTFQLHQAYESAIGKSIELH